MQFLPLTPADVEVMAQIEALAHSHPMSQGMLNDCFGPLYRVTGLRLGDELVGFAIVQQIVDEATLFDICIAPSAQGQGFGAKLLHQVIEEALSASACVLMLEVRASNKAAIALYRKLGFNQAGCRPNYYPSHEASSGREDALLMDLSLASPL